MEESSSLPIELAPASWARPEFPKLRMVMGVVGGLTLAAFIYHSVTATSRLRNEQAQRGRESRYMGLLHHEEANKRFVSGDMVGAVKHYSKAARFALQGGAGEELAAATTTVAAAAAAGADPASLSPPDLEGPGADGWALSLLQRAAAHWKLGDANSCVRDCLAVLRALHHERTRARVCGRATVDAFSSSSSSLPPPSSIDASMRSDEPSAAAAAAQESHSNEEGQKKEEDEEGERRAKEQRAGMRVRIVARACELLGRALAASGQPLAALVALQQCASARSKRSEGALLQLRHLRKRLRDGLAATSEHHEQGATNAGVGGVGGSVWPVQVVPRGEDADGQHPRQVLVATTSIAEGGDILVEKPLLVAPAHFSRDFCVHCLRRLTASQDPTPPAAATAPAVTAPAPLSPAVELLVHHQESPRYCSSVCEAAAWLLEHEPAARRRLSHSQHDADRQQQATDDVPSSQQPSTFAAPSVLLANAPRVVEEEEQQQQQQQQQQHKGDDDDDACLYEALARRILLSLLALGEEEEEEEAVSSAREKKEEEEGEGENSYSTNPRLSDAIHAAVYSLPPGSTAATTGRTGVHASDDLQALAALLCHQRRGDGGGGGGNGTDANWDVPSLMGRLRGGALLIPEKKPLEDNTTTTTPGRERAEISRGLGLYALAGHVLRSSSSSSSSPSSPAPNAQLVCTDDDATVRLVALRTLEPHETITIHLPPGGAALSAKK